MRAKAERHGLCLMDEDREVLALMKGDVLIRARYIRTGFFTWPAIEGPHMQEPSRECRKAIARRRAAGASVDGRAMSASDPKRTLARQQLIQPGIWI